MSWKDERDNLHKVLETGTAKDKIDFVWTYYKWQISLLCFIILFVAYLLSYSINSTDCQLTGVFLGSNGDPAAVAEIKDNLLADIPDAAPEEMFFDASLTYSSGSEEIDPSLSAEARQSILIRAAAGDIDFLVGDVQTLANYSYSCCFLDLTEILSEEEMVRFQPYFLYYDRSFLEQLSDMELSDVDGQVLAFPAPGSPEDMEEPVPVMLDVTEGLLASGLYRHSAMHYAIGFVVNGDNTQNAILLADYLIELSEG